MILLDLYRPAASKNDVVAIVAGQLRGAGLEDCLAFANLAGAYSTTKEGGTEAFRDRNALASFMRQQWSAAGRGTLPLKE